MNQPIRCALYIRVSTQEQSREGYGLEYQKNDLLDLVKHKSKHHSWHTQEEWMYVDDGYSGASMHRPAFKRMMDDAKKGKFDMIVVWKIDRLARDLLHLLRILKTIDKSDVQFYSLKENFDFSGTMGKLILQIIGALAEFEKNMIRDRTAEGRLASAKSGNYLGRRIPYGFKKVKNEQLGKGSKLVIEPIEAKWVKQIFDWFTIEEWTYEHIKRMLNDMDVPKSLSNHTTKGTKWDATTLKKMLQSSIYKGVYISALTDSNGILHEVKTVLTPTVDNWKWLLAQERIAEIYSKHLNRGSSKRKYLLSRKIIDKHTGRYFIGYTRSKDGKVSYRRKSYVDASGMKQKSREIPSQAIEAFVWQKIELIMNDTDRFYQIYQSQQKAYPSSNNIEKTLETLQQQKKQLTQRESRILMDYYDGNISKEKREELGAAVLQQIEATTTKIRDYETQLIHLARLEQAKYIIEDFSARVKGQFSSIDVEKKQKLVQMLVKEIEVDFEKDPIQVKIRFQFAQPTGQANNPLDEPKLVLKKRKKPTKKSVSSHHGGGGGNGYFWIDILGEVMTVCQNNIRQKVIRLWKT